MLNSSCCLFVYLFLGEKRHAMLTISYALKLWRENVNKRPRYTSHARLRGQKEELTFHLRVELPEKLLVFTGHLLGTLNGSLLLLLNRWMLSRTGGLGDSRRRLSRECCTNAASDDFVHRHFSSFLACFSAVMDLPPSLLPFRVARICAKWKDAWG